MVEKICAEVIVKVYIDPSGHMFWVPIAVGAAEGTAYVSYRYGPQISNAVTTYGPKIVNGASRCYNTAVIYGSQAMNMLANQVDKIPSIFNMGSDAASKAVEKSGSSNSGGGSNNFDPNDPKWRDKFGKDGAHFTEKDAGDILAKMESKTKGAHYFSRHGAHTTLKQQYTRATTGLTPDGVQKYEVDSSKFISNNAQLKAVVKAEEIYKKTGRNSFEFNMCSKIGEGYLKGGGELLEATRVQAVFKNGELFTLYPLLQ